MKAVIYLDVPDWQIGQDVTVYFPDTMLKHGKCELLKEQAAVVRCRDCKHATMTADGKMCKYCEMDTDDFGDQREVYHDADWFCADGEQKQNDALTQEEI